MAQALQSCRHAVQVGDVGQVRTVNNLRHFFTGGFSPAKQRLYYQQLFQGPAPRIGEHSAAILAEIGLERAEIERLATEKIVRLVKT